MPKATMMVPRPPTPQCQANALSTTASPTPEANRPASQMATPVSQSSRSSNGTTAASTSANPSNQAPPVMILRATAAVSHGDRHHDQVLSANADPPFHSMMDTAFRATTFGGAGSLSRS